MSVQLLPFNLELNKYNQMENKHLFLMLLLLFSTLCSFPQGKITRQNGHQSNTISSKHNDVKYDVSQYVPIDLGLSVKWSNQNMGASESNIDGYTYGWSEITPRKSYSWKENTIPKIKNISENLKYDVAAAKLGNGWRMPTADELHELKTKCKWIWNETLKGFDIYGPNGNSIFLPAYKHNGNDGYWSGTRTDNNIEIAYGLFYANKRLFSSCVGIGNPCYIRPVK